MSNRFDHTQFVAAITQAYCTKDYTQLDELVRVLVASYGRGQSADVIDTVRNDSLLAIAQKMLTNTPAITIAPQIPSIIWHKLQDACKSETRRRQHFSEAEDSVITALPAPDDVAKLAELNEELRYALLLLKRLKAENERYYDAVVAHLVGYEFDSIVLAMCKKHGPMTRDNVSKILSRGHEMLRTMRREAQDERAEQ